jgi:mannitol/fructose-specific phosphotransferase system IIA component (Ntr-type)
MKIRVQDLILKNCVIIDLVPSEKLETLGVVARFLCSANGLSDAENVVDRVVEREMEMSTGIGYGIAIPHARLPGISCLYMAAARLAEGIEFDSLDGAPVNLIFMMASPASSPTDHIQVLSALSQIMSYEDVRKRLLEADTPEAFADIIANAENKYIENRTPQECKVC